MEPSFSTQLRTPCLGPQTLHPHPARRAWPFPTWLQLGPAASAAAPTSPAPSSRASVGAGGPAAARSSASCVSWTPASAGGRSVRDISVWASGRGSGSASGRGRPDSRERTAAGAPGGKQRTSGSSGRSGGDGRPADGKSQQAHSREAGGARSIDRRGTGSTRTGEPARSQRAPPAPAALAAPAASAAPHTSSGPGAGRSGTTGAGEPPSTSQSPPAHAAARPVSGPHPCYQPQPHSQLPLALAALLRVVGPLEDAGWAYWAVRRTAAWLQGARVPLQAAAASATTQQQAAAPSPSPLPGSAEQPQQQQQPQPQQQQAVSGGAAGWVPPVVLELELEVQWDQLAAAHDLFSRPGCGWAASPLQQQPALGRASFRLALEGQPEGQPEGQEGPGQPEGQPEGPAGELRAVPVSVVLGCTYNTVLRANPARVQVAAAPPERQQPQRQHQDGGGGGVSARPGQRGQAHGLLQVLVGPEEAEAEGEAEAGAAAGRRQQRRPLVWVQSLYSVGVEAEREGDTQLAGAVEDALRRMQRELSAHNSAAWGRDTAFDAWCARFGPPEEAAARLVRDPGRCLGPLLPHLLQLQLARGPAAPPPPWAASAHPDAPPQPSQLLLRGLTAANLCGSHGHKAAALGLLGAAHVTVLDVSAGNAAYATRLAAAAGLQVAGQPGGSDGGSGGCEFRYLLADLADCRPPGLGADPASSTTDAAHTDTASRLYDRQYDLVLMELGVLHYFLDLRALMRHTVAPLLRPGGRLVIREFHPVSTKLVTSRGKKHKVTGDYFSSQPLAPMDVAYSKYEEAAAALGPAAGAAAGGSGGGGDDGGGRAAGSLGAGGGSGSRARVLLRRWGLGEVVSAVCAGSGGRLALVCLDEEAGARLDDCGLPKLFTLVAERTALP